MTSVSNDPSWWPFLHWMIIFSYFAVLSSAVVIYDWALTCGQEFELIWRWSHMTALYIGVRYVGILYAVITILWSLPVSITDVGCTIFWFMQAWIFVVVNAMLGVIMMARIYAMYQGSKKMLIFLVVVWLASTIASGVMIVMANISASGEELILSGNHQCSIVIDTNGMNLNHEIWIPTVVWEVLALFLAVWIVIKHFYELQQSLTGPTIGDYYTVLFRSHVLYFAAFAAVSFFNLGLLSPILLDTTFMGSAIYSGILQFLQMLQMFVLGPRLILSVREHHAKLVARSDGGTRMTTFAFQELRRIPNSSDM